MSASKSGKSRLSVVLLTCLALAGTSAMAADATPPKRPIKVDRPAMDDCAAGLISGRHWTSDLIFTKDELDGLISDNTTDNSYPAQRAAEEFADCSIRVLFPPPSEPRTSNGFRFTITPYVEPRPPKARMQPSNATARPYANKCLSDLKERSTTMTVKLDFAADGKPRVQRWSVTSNRPTSADSRLEVGQFATCVGRAMRLAKKPEIK